MKGGLLASSAAPLIRKSPRLTVLVDTDDAHASEVVECESAFAYFAARPEYIKRHGKPVAFYSDKHSIFRIKRKDGIGASGMTQFGWALHELNIDIYL